MRLVYGPDRDWATVYALGHDGREKIIEVVEGASLRRAQAEERAVRELEAMRLRIDELAGQTGPLEPRPYFSPGRPAPRMHDRPADDTGLPVNSSIVDVARNAPGRLLYIVGHPELEE